MNRFTELLEKRKALKATIFEEEELIELSKKMPKDELDKVDPMLLTTSNSERLDSIEKLLDEMNTILDRKY